MKLKRRQVVYMLVNVICIKMIMMYPHILVRDMGNAAWINVIYVTLAALMLYFICTAVYKSEYGTIIDAAQSIGGNMLKRLTGSVSAAVLIMNMAFIVRSYPETVKTVLLPQLQTPIIISVYLFAAAIGAYMGIESSARVHTIFMPAAGVVLIGFFLLSIPYWNFNNIMPVLGNGAYKIFGEGTLYISIFSDIILLNFLIPYIKIKRDIKSSGRTALIISGIVSFMILGTYNLIYPYPMSTEFILPVYQIARIVRIGTFFQRMESLFQFIWSIGIYLYTSLYIAVTAKIIADSFDLKYSRPIIFASACITGAVAYSFDFDNGMDKIKLLLLVMLVFSVLPVFLYGVIMALMQDKKKGTVK